jgi:hypothetical protein
MSSDSLIPHGEHDRETSSIEVEFALVIARMIETIGSSPDDMRHLVYDLARYKLREQFTHSDARDVVRTQEALETAIRGVEAFSKKQPASTAPHLAASPQIARLPSSHLVKASHEAADQFRAPEPPIAHAALEAKVRPPRSKRAIAALLAVAAVVMVLAVSQRDRITYIAIKLHSSPAPTKQNQAPAQALIDHRPPPAKKGPQRPTDYGVYAVINDELTDLAALPVRAPDVRIAISAAFQTPPRARLANGHPKFIIFRRDVAGAFAERTEVRIIARVAREFSNNLAGKKPADGDDMWVIRNVSFPFRASPLADNPEMYELHSQDPALELPPGRYALVLNNQSYDFSVEGPVVDPRHCIERIVGGNGIFYSDCKQP